MMKQVLKVGFSKVRHFNESAQPVIFRTLVHGNPQPWRQDKQVPPNPDVLKWQWEPEKIPTPAEYEQPPQVVTIFGGSGFLGMNLIEALLKRPEISLIRVCTRFPDVFLQKIPVEWHEKVKAEFVNILDQHNVLAACEGSQGLINLMGISYECELDFYEAHVQASKWISHSANTVFASRYIHVSSLASRLDSWSKYSDSKFRGEDAALACFPWTTILRFGPLFGKDTPAIKKLTKYLKYSPMYPCFASKTKIQPTFVKDAAESIAAALFQPETRELQFDLGGPKEFTHAELAQAVMKLAGVKRPVVPVPDVVGDSIVSLIQWIPDPIATRDLVYLLKSHHVVNNQAMRSWKDLIPNHKLTNLEEGFNL